MIPMDEFTEEQQHYLQGFVSGSDAARVARGLNSLAGALGLSANGATNGAATNGVAINSVATNGAAPAEATPAGPEKIHFEAQNRFIARGKKLSREEIAKREKHPLDMWDEMKTHAVEDRFPKGTDVLLWKFHGLFYVAPNQDSYMCRLRFPGGIVKTYQFNAVADVAERYGGGYSHGTTRANLQIREIGAKDGLSVLTELHEAGVVPRGSGADNIRNITGSPTAGIDPLEIFDTRPLARDLNHTILNHKELYGLPRKFNIAFDGGGTIGVVEDTNDIGFLAVRVGEGKAVPEGIYFRMQLGGITGHETFAADTGVLLKPEECVPAAVAVVRAFIEHGDRTDRNKARLKYVLDRMGLDAFMVEVKKYLPFEPTYLPLEACEPRPEPVQGAHIGVHPQRQDGLFYIGVLLPLGRMDAAQMRGLSHLADLYGDGELRLTVWQNLLIAGVSELDVPAVQAGLQKLGFDWKASNVRTGLIACTGNFGCKFSASDTKLHASQIADHLDERLELDHPINIHLTGCHHSCAQHYIGDIGLLGAKVEVGDDMVEGYHLYIGGGYGTRQKIGREVYRDIVAEDVPTTVERMARAYLEHRSTSEETFSEFTNRHEIEELKALFETVAVSEPALAA